MNIKKLIVTFFPCLAIWTSQLFCQEEKPLVIGSSNKYVNCIDFSDGGSILAFGDGQNVGIIRPGDNIGNVISAPGHLKKILSLDISPDSSMIVSGGSDNLIIIHGPDGKILNTLDYHSDKVTAVRFSPSGTMVYSGSADRRLICYSLSENKIVFEKTCSKNDILSIDVSSDGKMIAIGGADHRLVLLNALTGEPFVNPVRLPNWIRCVKFNENHTQLAACCDNGKIYFWKFSQTGSLIPQGHLRLSFDWITSMDYFSDNISFIYASDNGKVGLLISGREYIYRQKAPIRMVQIRPRSKYFFTVAIATSGNGILQAKSTLLMKRTVQNAHLLF